MKNETFQSNGEEDSENSQALISKIILIGLLAFVFIGFYDRKNSAVNRLRI